MTVLKVMCGTPASGKTQYVKTHAKPEDLIVSRDEIRYSLVTPGIPLFSREEEVFQEFYSQINNGIHTYETIWADATHLNNTSRWKLLYNINRYAFEKIVFVCIETSLETCLKRNQNKSVKVPETAIRQMYASYRRPNLNDFLSLNVEIEIVKEK